MKSLSQFKASSHWIFVADTGASEVSIPKESTMERTFTSVNDEVLIQAMKAARRKLVYVAPGITARVAQALVQQCKEHNTVSGIVILDIDPEVYRLGYGEIAGLEQLQQCADNSGFVVRHQPGVRIGLLISDENILIYSPTPLLIEAGSQQPEKPNAIVLKDISLAQIECACGSADASLQASSEIGITPVEDTSAIPAEPSSPMITVLAALAFRKHRCENTPLT
jgi:hypothetical protein